MIDWKDLVLTKHLLCQVVLFCCPLPTIFVALVDLADLSDNILQSISSSNQSRR